MAQRRHHYETAFEEYLRARRVPYVAVDEARKALLPEDAPLRFHLSRADDVPAGAPASLKSFDFVLYGEGTNLLVEIKGRRVIRRRRPPRDDAPARHWRARLECWVTQDDVASLRAWQHLFGPGFVGAFVFVYWCDDQPPDGLFHEVFEHRARWYSVRAVTVDDYAAAMKVRSPRWRTMHLPPGTFERLYHPLLGDADASEPPVLEPVRGSP